MMEAARTSETSVDNYFTWQYVPEDKSEVNIAEIRIVTDSSARVARRQAGKVSFTVSYCTRGPVCGPHILQICLHVIFICGDT
jgi:hypothetical protein